MQCEITQFQASFVPGRNASVSMPRPVLCRDAASSGWIGAALRLIIILAQAGISPDSSRDSRLRRE
jgi:hypothetical protein